MTSQVGNVNQTMYVVAVSGGVDSVALLHMLSLQTDQIIVAHVDHGIREDSYEDYLFVQSLADQYGFGFKGLRLELGSEASEELARTERYKFLFKLAREYKARLVTGHHADDVVETVAINLKRSTGWRGLAGLSDKRILRPLTHFYKDELYAYAEQYGLEWREDQTNQDARYLRNDLRNKLKDMPTPIKQEILALWRTQLELRQELVAEARKFTTYSRYWYTMVPDEVAMEVLHELLAQHKLSLTRPQTANFLIAIKVAKPGAKHSLLKGWEALFTRSSFSIQSVK